MPRVDLKLGEQKKHVNRALKEIREGNVIVVPLEHGYVYLADAFSPSAVRAMHELRGDEAGVVAQVLAYSLDTVKGISRAVSTDTQNLCNAFWPGLLSVTLRPPLFDAPVHIRPKSFSISYLYLSTSILYAVVKERAQDRSCAGKSCWVPTCWRWLTLLTKFS